MRRNLFYSVFAARHTKEWRANVEELAPHLGKFDGRKLVVVRSDATSEDPAAVEEAFAAFPDVEFIHRENNPELGEVEGWVEDFGRLYSLREDEATFYAHTKGTRYRAQHPRLPGIRSWRQGMYRGCLDPLERVELALRDHVFAGVFKVPFGRCTYRWHYSGTFWWVQHQGFFSRAWDELQDDRFGVECLPGDMGPSEIGHCLAYENAVGLYDKLPFQCSECERYQWQWGEWLHDRPATCEACGGAMVLLPFQSMEHLEAKNGRWSSRSRNWRKPQQRFEGGLLDEKSRRRFL